MQKWTQAEAVAFECACEVITDLRAILTGERYHDNPTPERLAEIKAEFSGLELSAARCESKTTLRLPESAATTAAASATTG